MFLIWSYYSYWKMGPRAFLLWKTRNSQLLAIWSVVALTGRPQVYYFIIILLLYSKKLLQNFEETFYDFFHDLWHLVG